jgi:chlorophyll synthase
MSTPSTSPSADPVRAHARPLGPVHRDRLDPAVAAGGLALGPWGFGAAAFGLALAWAYSAPPLRLKRNGWWGNAACGLCYEGLAWITGAAVMAGGAPCRTAHRCCWPCCTARRARHHDPQRLQVHRGRPPHGHRLAAGALGVRGAAQVACWIMALPQGAVVGAAVDWGQPWHAATVAGAAGAGG